jgi:membrane protease YdiL (CAAX protease family)
MTSKVIRLIRQPGVPIGLLCLACVLLVALHLYVAGWILLIASSVTVWLQPQPLKRHLTAVLLALAILAITPVSAASLDLDHVALGMLGVWIVAAIPYVYLELIHKEGVVKFNFHHGRRWYKTEILYIFFTAAMGYLLLPLYFVTTGGHNNWEVIISVGGIAMLLFGLLAVGIWDEIFFIASLLGIFKKHLPFWWANIAQSVFFVSFLYELGFRSWVVIPTTIFALIQGYVFHKTKSLLYAITIHLTFDMVLFVALIHAHYPDLLQIFITG